MLQGSIQVVIISLGVCIHVHLLYCIWQEKLSGSKFRVGQET